MAHETASSRPRWSFRAGVVLLAAGAALLVAAGAYYGYGVAASRGLDDIAVERPDVAEVLGATPFQPVPTSSPPASGEADSGAGGASEIAGQPSSQSTAVSAEGDNGADALAQSSSASPASSDAGGGEGKMDGGAGALAHTSSAGDAGNEGSAPPVAGEDAHEPAESLPAAVQGPAPERAALHPGSLLPARQWADPRGTIALAQPDLSGFTPLSNLGQPIINGVVGRAERIIIPQLHIDASVEELGIANIASSAAYETPKFTVGHIPATPNPGSHGNGWYFGHLESPVEGEGSVFASLPRAADLLRDGEDVHIILRADGGREYLYAASSADLLHQNELAFYRSDDARITLVTCYPRLRYDHRLLVTGQLIGFRHLDSA